MLDDKTVTEQDIEDKCVQEVTAKATKVCCCCGEELSLSSFRMDIMPSGHKSYRAKCKHCTWLDSRDKKLQKKAATDTFDSDMVMLQKRQYKQIILAVTFSYHSSITGKPGILTIQ